MKIASPHDTLDQNSIVSIGKSQAKLQRQASRLRFPSCLSEASFPFGVDRQGKAHTLAWSQYVSPPSSGQNELLISMLCTYGAIPVSVSVSVCVVEHGAHGKLRQAGAHKGGTAMRITSGLRRSCACTGLTPVKALGGSAPLLWSRYCDVCVLHCLERGIERPLF